MEFYNKLKKLVFALVLFSVLPNLAQAVSSGERSAVIAFYNSTGGPGWFNKTGWLAPAGTECDWYGVSCDISLNVTGLSLYDNKLTGSLPAELGNLIHLTNLAISKNPLLTGTIPSSIGNLANLQNLYLWGNGLTGSIPATIGNLVNLVGLGLYDNNLTGPIPVSLQNLTSIYEIRLLNNQLSGNIPPELGNLSTLSVLSLENNNLSGSIPPQIAGLTNVWAIHLSYNQLSGSLPPEMGNMTNLGILDLEGNNLTGEIPASFINLVNLMYGGDGYGFRIDYNGLHTADSALLAFLEQRSSSPFTWTQTLDADGVSALSITENGVGLNWNPVDTTDAGGYRVYLSQLPDSGFVMMQQVAGKAVTTTTITGLASCTTYYARVHSYTSAFWLNPKNEVESDGLTGNLAMFTTIGAACAALDSDSDGIPDATDNCTLVANPSQLDTDGDGFGNMCDPDLNNDGIVNSSDLFIFKSRFLTSDPDADFNGDGVVNSADLFILKARFLSAPGPSGTLP